MVKSKVIKVAWIAGITFLGLAILAVYRLLVIPFPNKEIGSIIKATRYNETYALITCEFAQLNACKSMTLTIQNNTAKIRRAGGLPFIQVATEDLNKFLSWLSKESIDSLPHNRAEPGCDGAYYYIHYHSGRMTKLYVGWSPYDTVYSDLIEAFYDLYKSSGERTLLKGQGSLSDPRPPL